MHTITGRTIAYYFTFADHPSASSGQALGNVSALSTNGNNFVNNSYAQYQSFGAYQVEPTTSTGLTDRGFTGHRHNNTGTYDLGLIYMNARYYMPEIGRFISPDTMLPNPANPQGINRYAYALNSPLEYKDPSGHWIESALDVAFIVYDIYDIQQNGLNWENGLSLVADVGGLILPVATGGGLVVRGAFHADEAAKLASHADEAADAARALSRADDTVDAARRFNSIGTEVLGGVLSTFGDGVARNGVIPEALTGRGITTIGKLQDTQIASEFGERVIGNLDWTLEKNFTWLMDAIRNGDIFYLASPVNEANLLDSRFRISVFARELDALLQAGYTRVGDYLIPPG